MYLTCRDCLAVEGEISGGAGVVGHSTAKAKIEGSPDCSVHAHAGHHATDKQLSYAGGLHSFKQIGIPKAIGILLNNDRLARQRSNTWMYLNSGSVRQEETCGGLCRDMLNVIDRP